MALLLFLGLMGNFLDDVNRVLDSARTIPLPPNREIIHTIPVSYTVDGIDKAKDQ